MHPGVSKSLTRSAARTDGAAQPPLDSKRGYLSTEGKEGGTEPTASNTMRFSPSVGLLGQIGPSLQDLGQGATPLPTYQVLYRDGSLGRAKVRALGWLGRLQSMAGCKSQPGTACRVPVKRCGVFDRIFPLDFGLRAP